MGIIWVLLCVLTFSVVLLWIEMGCLRRELLRTRLDKFDARIEAQLADDKAKDKGANR